MNHWMHTGAVFRTLCGIGRFDAIPDGDTITFPADVERPKPPDCPACITAIRRMIVDRIGDDPATIGPPQ